MNPRLFTLSVFSIFILSCSDSTMHYAPKLECSDTSKSQTKMKYDSIVKKLPTQ